MRNLKASRKGFSVVELLIVLAIVGIVLTVLVNACGGSSSGGHQTGYQPGTRPSVTVETFLLKAEDFDLALVSSLLKEGKEVKNITDLEAKINDPASGINNINLDKENGDTEVDYVGVNETDKGDGTFLIDFVANPKSSSWTDGPFTFATMTFNPATGEVTAAYTDRVHGYRDYYYAFSGFGIGNPFYGYLYTPHPAYMFHYPIGYVGYSVASPTVLSSTRSSYRSTTVSTTVSPTKRPASYTQSASAAKSSAKVATKAATSTGSSKYTPTTSSAASKKASPSIKPSSTPAPSRATPSRSTTPSRSASPSRSTSRSGKR